VAAEVGSPCQVLLIGCTFVHFACNAEAHRSRDAAAFGMSAAWYNFGWQTRKPGKSGGTGPTVAVTAKLTGRVWSFDELFEAVLGQPYTC
jgi:hypothetical protein